MSKLASLFVLGLIFAGHLVAQPADEEAAAKKPPAAARLANADAIRRALGLEPYLNAGPSLANVKIAILDHGFAGMETGRPYLPETTELVERYDPPWVRKHSLGDPEWTQPLDPANAHGRFMAQIAWGTTGFRADGPKFYLLNANGPTMLRRAVRYAVEKKVDLILFSNVFDGVGNGDGRGPINRIVEEAVAAGVIWINAAGNSGRRVYNGPIEVLSDGYVRLGLDKESTALRFRNRLDENNVTVTLSWNSFRDTEDAGTDKDLDLYVVDPDGMVVGSSTKRQVLVKTGQDANESLNPRERVTLTNLKGDARSYRLLVKAKQGTFTTQDRLRILISDSRESYFDPATGKTQDAIDFVDASEQSELQAPADHPQVLTVGDTSRSSAWGPTLDYRVKPDVLLPSSDAAFTNGDVTAGASNAAAYFAGVAAVLKAAEPDLRARHLFAWSLKNALRNAQALDRRMSDAFVNQRTASNNPSFRLAPGANKVPPPSPGVPPPSPGVQGVLYRRQWHSPTPAELHDLVKQQSWDEELRSLRSRSP